MSQDFRAIYNSIDITPKVADFRAGTQAFSYTAGSYLYLGSVTPFNNLWFEMAHPNNASATVSIQNWWGNSWVDVVDVTDETNALGTSGRVSWSTDRLKGWDIEQTSEDVAGISSFKIYWKYWLRFSWSHNFNGNPLIGYIGQKFSTDSVLYSYYPDLNNTTIRHSFANGKSNWDEQHFAAAEMIESDLKKKNIVISRSQIFDWKQFEEASCHKVAEIIYRALGQPYADQLTRARDDYRKALDTGYPIIDRNLDGKIEPIERQISTTFWSR